MLGNSKTDSRHSPCFINWSRGMKGKNSQRKTNFGKISFANQSLKAAGYSFQKIYDIPWPRDAF